MPMSLTSRHPLALHLEPEILTTTTATEVMAYSPTITRVVRVQPGAQILNAATTLTLTATWTDPTSGSQQTYTWANAENLPVGPVPIAPILVTVAGGTTLTVTATAGTAGNIVVSGSIEWF